jgi:ubiquinone/menaquinone biosynthesis C-methylase UbiE
MIWKISMKHPSPVQVIFNQKARSWSKKYDGGGMFTKRIQYFSELLSQTTPPPAKILDFGCGTGNLALSLSQNGYQITACDIAEEMLKVAKTEGPSASVEWLLLAPHWNDLPFDSEVFDAIVASSTFEYLENVKLALAECSRTIKRHGTLAMTVPNLQCRARRKERQLRQLIDFPLFRYLGFIPKVKQYFSYLRLSKNRFSRDEWRDLGRQTGLVLSDELSKEVQTSAGATLLLLCFKKG